MNAQNLLLFCGGYVDFHSGGGYIFVKWGAVV